MKKFILNLLFYVIPFWCVYGGYKIFKPNIAASMSGDIGRLGQIEFGKEYDLFLKKNYLLDNLTIDRFINSQEDLQEDNVPPIFTIGDSFSGRGKFGYQNYLAHILNDSILNIKSRIHGANLQIAMSLLNSKIINKLNCQICILEHVDRRLINALCNIDFEKQYQFQNTTKQQHNNTDKDAELYKLCTWIRLQLDYGNPIFKHNLKQDCFTHERYSHTLFRYKDDFNFKNTQPAEIEKAKENLILLNKKFSEKGIKLIFLIAADKYDVYRPFMTDDALPVDTTTDALSQLPNVCIINTKPMLQEMVRRGEKDVYMVNDTHWSYKASEAVARKLAHDIDSLGIMK